MNSTPFTLPTERVLMTVAEATEALHAHTASGTTAWLVRLCRAAIRGEVRLRLSDGYPVEPTTIAADPTIPTHVLAGDLCKWLSSVGVHSLCKAEAQGESHQDRCIRLFEEWEAEVKDRKRGALQRVADRTQIDRSNLGKMIRKGREWARTRRSQPT